MLESVMNSEMQYTVVAISNDPLIMSACDRVIVLDEGMVAHEGTFAELMRGESMKNYIE
jgi:ABC-type multidrug transport system fused ATPase/permease subunit